MAYWQLVALEEERRRRIALGLPPDPPEPPPDPGEELRAFLEERLGPRAVPTGTTEKPPIPDAKPLWRKGPSDIPGVQQSIDTLFPMDVPAARLIRAIGSGLTTPPDEPAVQLQRAHPIEKVMMGLPVGAPVGSLAGTAGRSVLTQAKVAAPRAATAAATGARRLATEEVGAVGKVPKKPVTPSVASEAIGPAAKPAQATEGGAEIWGTGTPIRRRIGPQTGRPLTSSVAQAAAEAPKAPVEAIGPAARPTQATASVFDEALFSRYRQEVPTAAALVENMVRQGEIENAVKLLRRKGYQSSSTGVRRLMEYFSPAAKPAQAVEVISGGDAMEAISKATPKAPVGAEAKAVSESVQQGSKVVETAPTGAPTAAAQGLPPPAAPRQPNYAAGPRAVPGQGPHSMVPPSQPPPPRDLPPAPPSGEFPSGRRPPSLEEAAARADKPLPPVDNYQRLVESSRQPSKEPLRDKLRETTYKFLREFTDRNQLLTQLGKATGKPVHELAQVVPGATLEGEEVLRLKVQPIYDALGRKDMPYLQDYMVAMRDSDILARNPHATLPGNVTGYKGVQEAIGAIRSKVGDERFARIQQAAEARWVAQRSESIEYAVGKGLLSADDARAMTSAHPHYIPFQRTDWVESLDRAYAAGTKPEASLSSLGIEAMDLAGSTRNLDNPLARMDAQLIRMRRLDARNRTAISIADSLEALQKSTGTPLIHYLEPAHLRTDVNLAGGVKPSQGHLPTPSGTVPGTISFIKNGEQYVAEVPQEYAAVAKGLYEDAPDGVTRLAGMMNQPLKMGATGLNTAFIPVNMVRDAQSAYFNAGLVPLSKYYWQGMAASFFKNETFSQAAQARALGGGFVESMRPQTAISRAQSRFYGKVVVHSAQDALLAIPRSIERFNVAVERGTRIGVYAKSKAKGLSDLEAAVSARNATADFSKAGNTMRVVNQWIPFSNAAVQGTAASVMRVKNKPLLAAVAATPFLAMTVLSRVNNMRFDSYNSIPDYVFNNNWVFQFGEVTHEDGTVYPVYTTVPKGQFVSAVVFPLEAMFNLGRKTNDKTAVEAVLQAGLGAAQNISPVSDVSAVVPVAPAQAVVETAANKNFYTGQEIVPQREQALPPEQQFDAETSKTAIAIGQLFGISPRKIDHAIQATTGGVGQQVAWLIGLGLQALGYEPEPFGAEVSTEQEQTLPEQLGTIPGVKRFIGTRNTQEARNGWEAFNEAVAETNRDFDAIPGVHGLGIRLGSVGYTIDLTPKTPRDSRELTPQERAVYQRLMGQTVITDVRTYVSLLDKVRAQNAEKGLPDQTADYRRTEIMKEMARAKDKASGAFKWQLTYGAPSAPPAPKRSTSPPKPSLDAAYEKRFMQWKAEHPNLPSPVPAGAR